MGEFESKYLFVHGSLSRCGHLLGGPKTVVRSLRKWIGSATLAMPTHTYCYPDPSGSVPIYDVSRTPSRVGAISEYFRQEPNVIRSTHPTHSICSQGPQSKELCHGHELCNTPCGKGTPYARLVKWDSAVLMFGVSLNVYTLFHTAEDEANAPYLYEAEDYSLRYRQNGTEHTMKMKRQDMTVTRRFAAMDQWLNQKGLLMKRRLGLGTLFFIPHAKQVHEALLSAMRDDPLFLVSPSVKPILKARLDG